MPPQKYFDFYYGVIPWMVLPGAARTPPPTHSVDYWHKKAGKLPAAKRFVNCRVGYRSRLQHHLFTVVYSVGCQ